MGVRPAPCSEASLHGVEAGQRIAEVEEVRGQRRTVMKITHSESVFLRWGKVHLVRPLRVRVQLWLAWTLVIGEVNGACDASRFIDDRDRSSGCSDQIVLAERSNVLKEQLRVGCIDGLERCEGCCSR